MSEYKDTRDYKKDINNILIVYYSKKYLNKCTGALILDGPLLNTTKTLILSKVVVNSNKIHVPQFNKNDYCKIKKQNLCKVNLCSMEEYINELSDIELQSINLCYFDYMGSIEGNKTNDLFPLEDMYKFLLNNHQSKLIFACTFSTRSYHGLFEDRTKMSEQMNTDFLLPLFKSTQWAIIDQIKPHCYRRKSSASMVFYLYVLKKDYTINPDLVEYPHDDAGRIYGYRDEYIIDN